jgi:CP family cyanate transporter-like MFS transporter
MGKPTGASTAPRVALWRGRPPRVSRGTLALAAGVLLIAANLRPALTSVAPLVGDVQSAFGLSGAQAGLLTSLPLAAVAVLSPAAAPLARRLGSERILGGGLFLLAAGILLRSSGSAAAVFAGTAVIGAGIAAGNVLLPAFVKERFPGRAGLMTSLHLTVMAATAGAAATLSVPLAHSWSLGWEVALAVWALPAGLALLIWTPTMPRGASAVAQPVRGRMTARATLRSPIAWQVTLFMAFQTLHFYSVVAWLPQILRDDGMSPGAAGLMLGLMQLGGLVCTMTVPVLAARRRDQRALVVLSSAACFAGSTGLLLVGAELGVVSVLLIGLGGGAWLGLAQTFFVVRAADADGAAALSGMAQTLAYALAAAGPAGLGAVHDATGSWTLPIGAFLAMTVAACAVGLGAAGDKTMVRPRPPAC